MSKANESITEIRIKKIGLGISIFIFLSTLPYWLIDRDSKLSIINMIFGKVLGQMGDAELDTDALLALQWARFYFHLIFTSIGLLIYFFSDTSKYIGYGLSRYTFAKYFHSQNKKMKRFVSFFKGVTMFAFVGIIYLLLMQLIENSNVPIQQFNLTMLIFLCLTVVWHTGYPEFEKILSSEEMYDFRNIIKLVKLGNTQIAYINKDSEDKWTLCLPDRDTDMSFSQSYISDYTSFNHHHDDVILLSTSFGSIKASISITVEPSNFPNFITLSQVHKLLRLCSENNFRELIFNTIEKEHLKNQLEDSYKEMKRFSNVSSINFEMESNLKFDELIEKMTTKELDKNFSQQINQQIKQLLINDDAFNIEFSITENSIINSFNEVSDKYEKLKEEARLLENEKEKDIRLAFLEQSKIMIESLMESLKSPAIPNHIAKERIEIVKELRVNPNERALEKGAKSLKENTSEAKILEQKDVDIDNAATEIGLSLYLCSVRNYSKEDVEEEISGSTSFFKSRGINFEEYLKTLFTKWDSEKEERTEEAYVALAKDSLIEIINKAK